MTADEEEEDGEQSRYRYRYCTVRTCTIPVHTCTNTYRYSTRTYQYRPAVRVDCDLPLVPVVVDEMSREGRKQTSAERLLFEIEEQQEHKIRPFIQDARE